MFNINLAIKFGGNEIVVYRKGLGIIAKEPAYLAVVENGKSLKVKAIGRKAEKLFLSKSSQVSVYRPIVNGEVVNEKMAVLLLGEILNNVITDKFTLSHLYALVAVPCALNHRQLKLIEKVLNQAGVNKVEFVQNAVCVQTNMELDSHSHIMVVDIGKNITDISVLNSYNFSFGRVYHIGGEDMDKNISTYIADNYNLRVDLRTCENIKNEIASFYERDLNKIEYIGLDENNKYVQQEIVANEVRIAIHNVYDAIFKFIGEVMNKLPQDVSKDVFNVGVVFVGGASEIPGLYEYAKKHLDLPIIVPECPADAVIIGAGKLLSKNKEFLKIKI